MKSSLIGLKTSIKMPPFVQVAPDKNYASTGVIRNMTSHLTFPCTAVYIDQFDFWMVMPKIGFAIFIFDVFSQSEGTSERGFDHF